VEHVGHHVAFWDSRWAPLHQLDHQTHCKRRIKGLVCTSLCEHIEDSFDGVEMQCSKVSIYLLVGPVITLELIRIIDCSSPQENDARPASARWYDMPLCGRRSAADFAL